MTIRKYKNDCAVSCDAPGCDNEMPGADEDQARSRAALVGWTLGKELIPGKKMDVCQECKAALAAAARNAAAVQQAPEPVDILRPTSPDDSEDIDEAFGTIAHRQPSDASKQAARNTITRRKPYLPPAMGKPLVDKRGATMPGVVETPEAAKKRIAAERKEAAERGKPIDMAKFKEVEDLFNETAWSPSARKGGSS